MQTPTHWQPFRPVQRAGVAFTCITVFWPQMTKVVRLLLKRGSIPDPSAKRLHYLCQKFSGVFFPLSFIRVYLVYVVKLPLV